METELPKGKTFGQLITILVKQGYLDMALELFNKDPDYFTVEAEAPH